MLRRRTHCSASSRHPRAIHHSDADPGEEARGRAAHGDAQRADAGRARSTWTWCGAGTDPAGQDDQCNVRREQRLADRLGPYDAKVTINGRPTTSVGSQRQFVSYGLNPGLSYKYVVKAEVVRDGQTVERSRTVNLIAGQTEQVAFGFNMTPEEQVAESK